MTASLQTRRTTVKRLPKRGAYDRATIEAIVDEALICHIGIVVDGQPIVIPTIHWRHGDVLYFHGSTASRMLRSLKNGVEACVTITLLDGLVLARSAFHHSMNYRSVVVFGRATMVEKRDEKIAALLAFSEHVVRGRWDDVREPTEQELKATTVLSVTLSEASAKVRTGPPLDDEEDYALPIWAGVIPLRLVADTPLNDPRLPNGLEPPDYVRG